MIRRKILELCLLSIVFTISCQQPFESSLRIKRIGEDILKIECLSVNTTAIAADEGIIVIGTQRSPGIMRKIKSIIEREFGRNDFIYVINTHGHWDHSSGNQIFPEATIVGQENCYDYMINNPANNLNIISSIKQNISRLRNGLETISDYSNNEDEIESNLELWEFVLDDLNKEYKVTPPTLRFEDTLTLNFTDLSLKMIYCGESHTNNHMLIHIPQKNILFTGDLFNSSVNLGFLINKMNDIPGVISAINKVIPYANNRMVIIPGHGDFLYGSDLVYLRDLIKRQYELYEDRNSAVKYLEESINEFGLSIAVKKFDEVLSISDSNYYLDENEFTILGSRLIDQGKPDEAVGVFRLGLMKFPRSALAYDNLARTMLQKGDVNSAIDYYNRSLEIFPNNNNTKELLKILESKE